MSINGFELSAAQKRTWREQEQNGKLYSTTVCADISGALDAGLLQESLYGIIDRHEIFRTAFVQSNAQLKYPLQVVSAEAAYPGLSSFDVSGMDSAAQQRHIQELFSNMCSNRKSLTGINCLVVKCSDSRHLLLMNLPALWADAATALNVLQEWLDDYTHEKTEHDDPYQFVQFSEWQHELLSAEDNGAKNTWTERQTAAGNADVLSVKSDTNAGVLTAKIDDDTIRVAHDYCRAHHSRPGHFLLAAWTLLAWYRQDKPQQIIIGNEVNGRSLENFDSINGPFAATLPLKAALTGDELFGGVLQAVRAEAALLEELQDVYAHDGETPAWQFQYIDAAQQAINLSAIFAQQHGFAARLACVNVGNSLAAEIQLDAAQYDAAALACTVQQFDSLVRSIASGKPVAVASLFKASEQERALVQSFNNTAVPLEHAAGITARLSALALQQPWHNAIKCGDETLTWYAFNTKANGLANHLVKTYGIGKGDIVAVKLERSALLMVAIFGILKTGAAYLPLDNGIPAGRLQYIMDDSAAKLLVTAGETTVSNALAVQNLHDELFEHNTSEPAVTRAGEDIFYLMYTSGSTGKPKGVLVTDRCMLNYTCWCTAACGLSARDASVVFSSLAFDLSYTALWPVLYNGGTLHLMQESTVFDPDHLLDILVNEPITFIKLTPSHFSLLISSDRFSAVAARLRLRWIVSGGEHIRPEDVATFFNSRKDIRFLNHYGPTETTIGVVTQPFTFETFGAFSSRPVIGAPISNTQVYVLDEQLDMLPMGALGEICIAGHGVSAGYLNREALAEEKFVRNPFGEGKLYRTGDLGRWLPDGRIALAGRKDFQVKINGYRIEPGEIERVMLHHEGVTKAYVTPSAAGNELLAFYTAAQPVSVSALRQHIARQLPSYMVPATITPVQQMPLLPNGKTDRSSLLKNMLMQTNGQDEQHYSPAETELEKQLAALWQQILETDRISIYDNFFDIGGNSFKLIWVFREFSRTWPGQLKLTDLFKYSTIHSLAAFLEASQVQEAGVEKTYGFEV